MGKFVTYGVTETLDNDQKFIIDSDRTGPGSITAKDAAISFLSKWAGFETFEEAVQNTIEHNQEFIDRDTAIREETAELKKKIVTTFPAKDASGAVATFESEFEDALLKSCIVRVEPVQDLHGYDSPWPAGGGKNLFDVKSRIDMTQSRLTFTSDADYIIVNGTKYGQTTFVLTQAPTLLKAGTYYFKAFTSGTATGVVCVDIYDVNKTRLIQNIHGSEHSYTFTEDTEIYVGIRVNDNNVLTNYTIGVVMSATSDITEFTPYSNECPISGFTGCEVQRTGKNLLNLVESEMVSTGWNRRFPISLKAGTYIISCQNQFGSSLKGAFVSLTDENDVTIIKALTSGYVFGNTAFVGVAATITEEEASKIKNLRFALRASGTTYNDIVQGNIQLELGSTPTAYEPYKGHIYPVVFPTEAGTVYGAYVDVTGGELVVDRVEVADLGTLSWSYGIMSNPPRFFASLPYSGKNDPWWVKDAMISTGEYTLGANVGQDGTDKKYGISTKIIYFTNAEYTNVNDFKASITGTQVVYRIATPIHYPLTPTEIKTLLGTNNIWANTGDTSVEYIMSDVSWYVEKKLRAFQSVLAGVEDTAVASKNYSANTYLIFNDDIYRVTKTITAGETIEESVNVTKTTVAEQLMALAQA